MKKKSILTLPLLILTLLFYAASVQAATPKYVSLYRSLLKKKTIPVQSTTSGYTYNYEMKSFRTLDVNRDGIPELFVKNTEPNKTFSTVRIYSVKNKKLFFCGEYGTKSETTIKYYKKYKGILNTWWTNGVGGTGAVMYGVSLKKDELPVRYWAWQGMSSSSPNAVKVYKIGKKQTITTEAKFNAYVDKYFNLDNYRTYKFIRNNATNRGKIK